MRHTFLSIFVVIALVGTGCGGSNYSANPTTGPSTVPAGQSSPISLTVNGRKSLAAIGETSQLTAVATLRDGTARDVTNEVRWDSQNPAVATVSSSGLATAVGFGAARIDARLDSGGGSQNNSFQIAVTPAGTFAATGDVREPGQGAVAGVRVLEPVSGRSTLTDQAGNYTLAALASTRLRFDKDGFEPGELVIAPDSTGYMRMQRIVRITAGDTAIVPKLTHMDVSYDVGGERCSPCRLIRIVAPAAGTIHLELAWDRNPGPPLYVWAGGQRFGGNVNEQQVTADAPIRAGENVVYVGYYRPQVMYGSSIQFTLATSMRR
jgi:Big-like domain-containing protein